MAASFRILGVRDWVARLPLAFSCILLCWVTYRFARAFDEDAALYSGLTLATCAGLFVFTRILIPDAMVTLTITGAVWAWLLLPRPEEPNPRKWSIVLGICMGLGLLLKGLIAIVFPILAGLAYMAITRQLLSPASWKRLHVFLAVIVALVIALPCMC